MALEIMTHQHDQLFLFVIELGLLLILSGELTNLLLDLMTLYPQQKFQFFGTSCKSIWRKQWRSVEECQ